MNKFMETTNTTENQTQLPVEESEQKYVSLKFRKPKLLVIALVVAGLLVVAALVFARGIFVAATVNGNPIGRFAVIQELEKQGGKQVLEEMISKKLIESEINRLNIVLAPDAVDEEIKKIETQVASQGGILKDLLAERGMTEEKLREQITAQKKLEILLGDKVAVSEAEIDEYLKVSKMSPSEKVSVEEFRKEIAGQLKQQKFQQEAEKWISELTANAKITNYVNY